jgi:hypothetical protein
MQSIATLSEFANHLRDLIRAIPNGESSWSDELFQDLALKLFTLQCEHNQPYRRLCEARGGIAQGPKSKVRNPKIGDWRQIPSVPTSAFKDFELTSLAPENRTTIFHSSGTTEHRPSRHFHNTESLVVYEESLLAWFSLALRFTSHDLRIICLTPPRAAAPNSSLVYMFESLGKRFGNEHSAFVGQLAEDGGWTVNIKAAVKALRESVKPGKPILVLGTAFSYVHLFDYLIEQEINFKLPAGSRALETGGYKGRSRTLPKDELHQLICDRLGISLADIICEYGMSELSSQAYDRTQVHNDSRSSRRKEAHILSSQKDQSLLTSAATTLRVLGGLAMPRVFHFPPWVRVQIISPENGQEVNEGETGLIRVCDLANVFSVMAVQTEDLGIRREDGFELVGRASLAEARGCSLTVV